MATAAIPTTSSLARKTWGDTALRASLEKHILFAFMRDGKAGTNMRSPIIVEDFDVGAGDTKSYPFLALKASNPITGDARVQGTGTTNTYASDEIKVDRIREEMIEPNVTMTEQRTKVDIEGDISEALGELASRASAIAIVKALTDTSVGRTANRYTYGSLASNYNATHATALANVDATDDKVSLDMIRRVMTKVKTKSSGVGFMQPAEVVTSDGKTRKSYIGFFHPNALIDLKESADYKNNVNFGQNDLWNVIDGYEYIGMYEGLRIYEFNPIDGQNDLLLVAGAGAGGINVAHNLILGAGALVYARGKVKKPKGNTKYSMSQNGSMMVTTVDDDHGGDAAWAYTKVEGYRKLVDNTVSGGEDFAVHHWFTSAASGL
ncbi:DUF4043 family protein [Rhizobium sp. Nf11,1]|uniref:phage capsid family protein n=1 Tax=Rhizobium sp. Nf11,1 TaxID=3404923 RepID=UPI003D3434F5